MYELDPQEHEKQHKLFAPSFRASAVRSQEHVVQEHVDLLVAQLRSQGKAGQVGLDLTVWMEWLAFDIIGKLRSLQSSPGGKYVLILSPCNIGELTFGESFGAIRSGKAHHWVSLLHGAIYGATLALLEKRIAIIGTFLRWAPALSQSAADSVKAVQEHGALTREKTLARIKMGNKDGVEDFLEPAIGKISEEQLAQQAYV